MATSVSLPTRETAIPLMLRSRRILQVSCHRKRNTIAKLYPIFTRQLFSECLRKKSKLPSPDPSHRTPRLPTYLLRVLDRDHLFQAPPRLVKGLLLSYRKYIVRIYYYLLSSPYALRPSNKIHASTRNCKKKQRNRTLPVKCACHCLDACFKPYGLSLNLPIFQENPPQTWGK